MAPFIHFTTDLRSWSRFPTRYEQERPKTQNEGEEILQRDPPREGPSHRPSVPASCFFDNTVDNPYKFPPDERYKRPPAIPASPICTTFPTGT